MIHVLQNLLTRAKLEILLARLESWRLSLKAGVSSRKLETWHLCRLDGFAIGRYEKNRESFDLYDAKFESGAMRFWREKSPRGWNPFKTKIPPLSFYYKEQSTANSNSFKIAQKTAFEAKGRLYTTGKVILRLFIIDLHTQIAIYGYIGEANCNSSTFTIK